VSIVMSNRAAAAPVRVRPARPTARPQLSVASRERGRRRLRARLLVWGIGCVTVLSLFTLVAFHVFAAQSAFTLDKLDTQRRNEQLRYERLREQVARLSSAGTVIEEARKLGMEPGQQVVTLPSPGVAPGGTPADPLTPLSTGNFLKTKQHLDPSP
jgi:hypothetical protein